MAIPLNPDTLRIPAFMRRRSLSVRLKKPLILTALDRKKARLAPLFLDKSKKAKKKKSPTKKILQRDNTIGILTHYYDKINVGVIKLSATIAVGDNIEYQTYDGQFEQIVESMEIEREPVFQARKGKEIGLKLKKIPKIGSKVRKL